MPGPSGATPTFAYPYPLPDDNVDVPRDVQALAVKLDAVRRNRAAATDTIESSGIPADVQPRWARQADGAMLWGPGGATAPDVILARSVANGVGLYVPGDIQPRLSLAGAGISFGAGGSTPMDTNLYRSGVDTLKTDDSVIIGGSVTSVGNYLARSMSGFSRWAAGLSGATQSPSGGSCVISHGMGISAVGFIALPWGVGNPGAYYAALNGDIPNSTQIRVYNSGNLGAAFTWICWG